MIVIYTNHKGEKRERDIVTYRLYWGSTDYHPEAQWMVECWDHEKKAMRDYALKDIEVPVGTALVEA